MKEILISYVYIDEHISYAVKGPLSQCGVNHRKSAIADRRKEVEKRMGYFYRKYFLYKI